VLSINLTKQLLRWFVVLGSSLLRRLETDGYLKMPPVVGR